MLVLSRKADQSIKIGSGPNVITITVLQIDHGKIRLGIDAPKEMPIYREELVAEGKKKKAD